MTQFWLARHGETDWNLEGRFQGQSDPPLNASGLAQAQQIAGLLVGAGIQTIYCSDLQRALLTAQIIGNKLGIIPQVDNRLREIHLGAWEGMLVEQIKSKYPEIWHRRQLDPVNVHPPGGENLSELALRVWAAGNQIAGNHPNETVLIVSHGVSLACLICRVRGLPLEQALYVIPENAQPIKVDWVWDTVEMESREQYLGGGK
jgi:broad specificity phosphatase PhoE